VAERACHCQDLASKAKIFGLEKKKMLTALSGIYPNILLPGHGQLTAEQRKTRKIHAKITLSA
jgi:hypothetical protein